MDKIYAGLFHLSLVVSYFVIGSVSVTLQNADFESSDYNGNWNANGCSISQSNDAYSGSHSVHVYNRHQNWQGIWHSVDVRANTNYKIVIYVKLLSNANNAMYQNVDAMVTCKDHNGKDTYLKFGGSPHVQHGKWFAVGGVKKIPSGAHTCQMYIQTPAPTEYLADHASIQEVTLDGNWKNAANQRIEQHRKADINIRLSGNLLDTTSVDISLQQTKHEFGFGSAVDASKIIDSSHHAYQNVFYDLFEWAVFENALKWYATEPNKGQFHYDTPLQAIKNLRAHGVKVRGHNVFWSVDKYVQDWVKGLSRSNLVSEISQRIQRVIGRTKGTLEHWDVNNENLHGDFYEQHTGNPDVTMNMFRQIHAIDSHPKLFLNEYNVISYGEMATALMDKAKSFRNAGVPIGGIGIQGHLKQFDLAQLWERLDILAEAGLPIWITEFAVNDNNENTKASKLDDLLTMFFSHPSVEGVLFWGFWDGSIWEHDAALFTGSSVTPNAAGQRLQYLLKSKWRTQASGTLNGHQTWQTRGFKGTYKLTVKHNNQLIKTEYFDLTSHGQSIQIEIDNPHQGGLPHVSNVIVG